MWVWLTWMNCLSLSLFLPLPSHLSLLPSCRGSENSTHSLSPFVASSLLYLLELSLHSRPSLPPAAAEFKVVQATHPLAPIQMGSFHWRPENVAKTVWRQVDLTGRKRLQSRNDESFSYWKDSTFGWQINKPSKNHNTRGREHFVIRTSNYVRMQMRKNINLRYNEND